MVRVDYRIHGVHGFMSNFIRKRDIGPIHIVWTRSTTGKMSYLNISVGAFFIGWLK